MTSDLLGRKFGESPVWDDLRVPVTAISVGGSNPPVFEKVIDSGVVGEGYALSFDGVDDYATIPHDDSGATPVFDFASTWSMSFWSSLSAAQTNNSYLFYHPSWSIRTRPLGVLRIEISGKTPADTSANAYLSGQRNHFVLVVTETSTTNVKLYINNALVVDETRTGTLVADAGADISVAYDSSANFAEMLLDDVRFYDSALSASDVSNLYANYAGTEEAVQDGNTVSYYLLNEGTGTQAVDSKIDNGTTHVMTISGATWVAGLVAVTNGSHGVFAPHFSPDIEQEMFFVCQLPHSWIEYATINPHIHWMVEDDEAGDVVWGLEYTWSNVNEVFGITTVITATDSAGGAFTHLIAGFDDIEGEDKKVSSMLMCRVFRQVSNAADTYAGNAILLEIDFHYQGFKGSRAEFHK